MESAYSIRPQVIVGGDFNMTEEDVLLDDIKDGCGMDSVLDTLHMPGEDWYTYRQSNSMDNNKSRIDHVFASTGMIQSEVISRAGIYKTPLLNSKHRVITIEIDIHRALNIRDSQAPKPNPLPTRALHYKDKDQCAKFAQKLDELASSAKIQDTLVCLPFII